MARPAVVQFPQQRAARVSGGTGQEDHAPPGGADSGAGYQGGEGGT